MHKIRYQNMETLSTHNHFTPAFGPEPFYSTRYNRSDNNQKKPLAERCLNIPERTSVKVQEKVDGKESTTSTKTNNKETTENQKFNFKEEMSSAKVHAPQSCEPPANVNSPAVFSPVAFESDIKAASDAEFGEREFFMRCILIGASNTGKHELIKANFADDKDEISYQRTGVNFINKTTLNFQTSRKYHFWINTLREDDSVVRDAIWKTYYKYSNAFVFVYDTTNKRSFEALEKAVQSVLEVVPREEFFGILIGTKNDLYKQREVDYNEVNDFRMRYNFKHFVETNSTQEKEHSQLLPRLNTKLKCTFEAI